MTPRCGWEIDDVVRELGDRDEMFSGLKSVQRSSDFAADLAFDTPEQAAALVDQLRSPRTPESMREALTELRHDGVVATVAFEPVVPMRLEAVEPGHHTACLLYTAQRSPMH